MNLGAKQADNFSSKSSLLQFIFSLLSLCWTVTKDSFIMQLSFPYFCTNHFLFVMFRAPSFPPSHRNRDDYIKCGSLFSLFLDCKTCNYLTLFFINFRVVFFFFFWLNVKEAGKTHVVTQSYTLRKAKLVWISDFTLSLWNVSYQLYYSIFPSI